MATHHGMQQGIGNAGAAIGQGLSSGSIPNSSEWAKYKHLMDDYGNTDPNEIKRLRTAELARKIKHIAPRNYSKSGFPSEDLSEHFDEIRQNLAAYKDLIDWLQAQSIALEAAYGPKASPPDPMRLRMHMDVLLHGFEHYLKEKPE